MCILEIGNVYLLDDVLIVRTLIGCSAVDFKFDQAFVRMTRALKCCRIFNFASSLFHRLTTLPRLADVALLFTRSKPLP